MASFPCKRNDDQTQDMSSNECESRTGVKRAEHRSEFHPCVAMLNQYCSVCIPAQSWAICWFSWLQTGLVGYKHFITLRLHKILVGMIHVS